MFVLFFFVFDGRRSIKYEAQSPLHRLLLLNAIRQTYPLWLELFIDHLIDGIYLGKEGEESFAIVHFGQDIWLNRLDVRLSQLRALLILRLLINFPDLLQIHLGVGTEGQFVGVDRARPLHSDLGLHICLKTLLVKLVNKACVFKVKWSYELAKLA